MLRYFPNSDRRTQIYTIALPIIGGMMSQNVLNLVDTAMVGSLGDAALAATGIGSFANFMAMAFILGLSTGVQAIAARRIGQKRESEAAIPLNGGLLLSLVLGVPLSIILIYYAGDLFQLLNSDTDVQSHGVPYLQVRLASMIGVGMNFSFRGYWSAVHLTKLYLYTLLIMHSVNIFLNWLLIFGNLGAPELGVMGAGLATTISVYLGTLIYFILAFKYSRHQGFMHGIPGKASMKSIITLSIPSCIQQLFFAAGMVALFWIIGQIGTRELAAANVLMTLALASLLPSMGLGIASASLIGQALGRNEIEDARLWGWNTSVLAAILGLSTGTLLFLFHVPILQLFIHDTDTLALAKWPLIIMAGIFAIDAIGMVLMQSNLGAGDSKSIMTVSLILQWVIFLPTAFIIGPSLGFGLLAVWIAQSVYRLVQAIIFALIWHRGKWQTIKV